VNIAPVEVPAATGIATRRDGAGVPVGVPAPTGEASRPDGAWAAPGRSVILPPDAVTVLVGAPASGKTTLREQLLAAGSESLPVLSPDDERTTLRARDIAVGREPRDLQDYSLSALRKCAAEAADLLAAGRGYLADATHLRRKERVAHVRAAHAAGLTAAAVLLPALPVEVLAARNERRTPDRRVPEDILAKHAHRRSLLTPQLLLDEGFDEVLEIPAAAEPRAGSSDARHEVLDTEKRAEIRGR
jgi:predicted kinase